MICSVLKRATTKYYLIQSFSDVILDKHFKDNYKIEYE